MKTISLRSKTVQLELKLLGGHLDHLVFLNGGRNLTAMHRAPWLDEKPEQEAIVLRQLSGDFLCAPFSTNDIESGPHHGYSANGHWQLIQHEDHMLGCRLEEAVYGADVFKEILLQTDSPFLYHRHLFKGGYGALPIGHHAMLKAEPEVYLYFSPKAFGMTAPTPLETDPEGYSALAYPQTFANLQQVRLADGGYADLSQYPALSKHDDLLHLIEAQGHHYGWSAAVNRAQHFVYLAIKDATLFPSTTLWQSNGGRDYAPFNGRHTGVLGIEEECSYLHTGHRQSIEANELTRLGYKTAIELEQDGQLLFGYAFALLALPEHWLGIQGVEVGAEQVTLIELNGERLSVPFDARLIGTYRNTLPCGVGFEWV